MKHLQKNLKSRMGLPILFICALCLLIQIPNALGQGKKKSDSVPFERMDNTPLHWYKIEKKRGYSSTDFLMDICTSEDRKKGYSIQHITTNSRRGGISHERYCQSYKDIPIEGMTLRIHKKNGRIHLFTGQVVKDLETDTPKINAQTAIDKALEYVSAETYIWENPAMEEQMKKNSTASEASYYPSPKLVYFNPHYSTQKGTFRLAYKMNIYATAPIQRYDIFVDAVTGSILASYEKIHHLNRETLYYGEQDIPAIAYLINNSNRIRTYTMPDNSTDLTLAESPYGYILEDAPDNQKASLDAFWGLNVSFEYFNSKGPEYINSLNLSSSNYLESYVNYGMDFQNAYWDGERLVFGSGSTEDGSTFDSPLTTIDIVAHELGHAITENYVDNGNNNNSGLLYQGESGAINEAYSDIFGMAIENYAWQQGHFDGLGLNYDDIWIMGELCTPNNIGIRSFSEPSEFGHPMTYGGPLWVNPENLNIDNGGVHINSSIMNHWFYLLVYGNDTMDPIDPDPNTAIEMGVDIILEAYNYLSYNTNYEEIRQATIQVANDLYGSANDCGLTTTVMDAWLLVGLGNEASSCLLYAGFDEPESSACINSTLEFTPLFYNPNNSYEYFLDGLPIGSGDPGNNGSISINFTELGNHIIRLEVSDSEDNSTSEETNVVISDCLLYNNNTIWKFGEGMILDFRTGAPVFSTGNHHLSESNINQTTNPSNPIDSELMFYMDAMDKEINDNRVTFVNEYTGERYPIDGLSESSHQFGVSIPNSNFNSSQGTHIKHYSVIFAPNPWRLFKADILFNTTNNNMTLEQVLPISSNFTQILDNQNRIISSESATVIPSCEKNQYWIISQTKPYSQIGEAIRNIYISKLSFGNTPDDFGTIIEEHLIGTEILTDGSSFDVAKDIVVSPDGSKFYFGNHLFSFNNETGEVVMLESGLSRSSMGAFSSNSRFLYLGRPHTTVDGYIYQYDTEPESGTILESEIAFEHNYTTNFKDLQLGPDHKIYVLIGNGNIDVIQYPNNKIANPTDLETIGYVPLFKTSRSGLNFPNFINTVNAHLSPSLQIEAEEVSCNEYQFLSPSCFQSYQWDINGQTVSNGQNFNHVFEEFGVYTISLTTTDIDGNIQTATTTVTIIAPQDIDIVGPDETCETEQTFCVMDTELTIFEWVISRGNGYLHNPNSNCVTVFWNDGNGGELTLTTGRSPDCLIDISHAIIPCCGCEYTWQNIPEEVEMELTCGQDIPLLPNPSISSSCDGDTLEVSFEESDSEQCGFCETRTIQRVWTAQSSVCPEKELIFSQTITIPQDATAPEFVTPLPSPHIIEGPGTIEEEFSDWLVNKGGLSAEDGCCSQLFWSHDFSGNLPEGCSYQQPVTFTVKDKCGNENSIKLTFQVEDVIEPFCQEPRVCSLPTNVEWVTSGLSGTNFLSHSLEWDDMSTPDNTTPEYEIIVEPLDCCPNELGQTYQLTTTGTSFPIPDSALDFCFQIKMRSICQNGETSEWSETFTHCPDPVSCSASTPFNVNTIMSNPDLSGENMELILSWQNDPLVDVETVTGYEVEFSPTPCCKGWSIGGTMTTTETSIHLPASTSCFIARVRAICITGETGSWSEPHEYCPVIKGRF